MREVESDEVQADDTSSSRSSLIAIDDAVVRRVISQAELKAIRLRFTTLMYVSVEPPAKDWIDSALSRWESHLAFRKKGGFSAHVLFVLRYSEAGFIEETAEDVEAIDGEDLPDIDLMAEYEVEYILERPEEFTEEDLEHFCSVNALQNTWGFWREYVHSITGRMGLASSVLPLSPGRIDAVTTAD